MDSHKISLVAVALKEDRMRHGFGSGVNWTAENDLLVARADNYAFQRSAQGALAAAGRGVKLNPIIGDHLTTIEGRITRAHDLPAQPAFHHTFVVAFLTGSKGWRSVTPDVCYTRHAARCLKAGGAVPNEISRVETTVVSVLVENSHQPVDPNVAIQCLGGLRIAGWMCDDFKLHLVDGF
jgi:hypothetical protein